LTLNDKDTQKVFLSSFADPNSFKKMQSGAGHDAQEISTIAPVGMIFIPSVNGISHSPKEFSKPVDMANGVKVLLQVILAIDKE